jgi:hypothetical protein
VSLRDTAARFFADEQAVLAELSRLPRPPAV